MARIPASRLGLCLLCAAACGAAPPDKSLQVTFTGIITRVSGNTFSIVTPAGAEVVLSTAPSASYQLNQKSTTFDVAVTVGVSAICTLGADGHITMVSAIPMFEKLTPKQVKLLVGVSEQEWKVLQPRIERILQLKQQLEGADAGNVNDPQSLANQTQALRQAAFASDITSDELRSRLEQLHKTRAALQSELTQQRHDLTELVTAPQEVILVLGDILE